MKTILFLLITITLLLAGCKAQDPAVKEAQLAADSLKYQTAIQALTEKEFVLEAERITFKNGRFTYVASNTNFISVTDGRATIQMAFNSPYAGPNGIGGITVEGMVSNIKMKTDKNGNVYYSMSVMGTGISAQVSFNMIGGTNQCTATVTPNFNSRTVDFTGYLYPTSESNVFKARAL